MALIRLHLTLGHFMPLDAPRTARVGFYVACPSICMGIY